jgi:hypothetical protein
MRQLSLACLLVVAALAMTGCAGKSMRGCGCGPCGGGGCGLAGRGVATDRMFGQNGADVCGADGCGLHGYFASGWRGGCHNQDYRQDQPPYGPQTAQVAYPYYTIRGPRDFLVDNPPSIGP